MYNTTKKSGSERKVRSYQANIYIPLRNNQEVSGTKVVFVKIYWFIRHSPKVYLGYPNRRVVVHLLRVPPNGLWPFHPLQLIYLHLCSDIVDRSSRGSTMRCRVNPRTKKSKTRKTDDQNHQSYTSRDTLGENDSIFHTTPYWTSNYAQITAENDLYYFLPNIHTNFLPHGDFLLFDMLQNKI